MINLPEKHAILVDQKPWWHYAITGVVIFLITIILIFFAAPVSPQSLEAWSGESPRTRKLNYLLGHITIDSAGTICIDVPVKIEVKNREWALYVRNDRSDREVFSAGITAWHPPMEFTE